MSVYYTLCNMKNEIKIRSEHTKLQKQLWNLISYELKHC